MSPISGALDVWESRLLLVQRFPRNLITLEKFYGPQDVDGKLEL